MQIAPLPLAPAVAPTLAPVQFREGPRIEDLTGRGPSHNARPALARRSSSTVFASAKALTSCVVECRPRVFIAAWCVILVLHVSVGAAAARALYSYARTVQDPTQVADLLRNFGLRVNVPVLWGASVSAAIVAASHALHAGRAVYFSWCYRELVFARRPPSSSLLSAPFGPHVPHAQRSRHMSVHITRFLDTRATISRQRRSWTRWLWRSASLLWKTTWRGVVSCSIHGKYFDLGFHAREAFEIAIQTYQAYRYSYLVPQRWICQLAVSVVVLNCWSTPLLHVTIRRNEPLRRVLCLATDIVLDFFSSMIIPLLVYVDYRDQVARTDLYDPRWVLQAGNTLLCFYLASVGDLVSRIMPNFSMLSCLGAIQPLLRRSQPNQQPHRPTRPLKDRPITVPEHNSHVTHSRPVSGLVHGFLALYGLVVVILNAVATHRAKSMSFPACQLPTQTWMVDKYPCALLELNCYRENWTGEIEELDELLSQVDEQSLAVLTITHCPRLQMPPRIRQFRNLCWLEIFNSTIRQWDSTAALTRTDHGMISRVMIVNATFDLATTGSIPEGLLHPDFPPTLVDVAIVHTNLGSLPSAAARIWPRRMHTLLIIRAELDQVPEELGDQSFQVLSLAENQLRTIPAGLLRQETLILSGNPLIELPEAPDTVNEDRSLHIEDTNISYLPSSYFLGPHMQIFATGSPVCIEPGAIPHGTVNCAHAHDDTDLAFPLERFMQRRRP